LSAEGSLQPATSKNVRNMNRLRMRIDSDNLGFEKQIAGREQIEEVGVVVVWFDAESPSWRLRSLLEERGWKFVQPAGAAALVDLVRARARTILCFGPTIAPTEIKSILDSLEHDAPESAYLNGGSRRGINDTFRAPGTRTAPEWIAESACSPR
jgi:hypothetical protein